MRESLRHGVTTHNWFAHYLWDIYGGFGHNGKIIQRTLPSHTPLFGPVFEICPLQVSSKLVSLYLDPLGVFGHTLRESKVFSSPHYQIGCLDQICPVSGKLEQVLGNVNTDLFFIQ